jgi:holliday junction DNA helicase RuvA
MIARLAGTLLERGVGRVIVDCGGVGYDVAVSNPTLATLPEPPAPVVLRVFTHVGEGIFALFGFATALERELFDLLISVSSVGPTTAMGVLSGAPALELASAIARGDAPALVRIRGIGKKTADRLVLELADKCQLLLATHGEARAHGAPAVAQPASKPGPMLTRDDLDVVSALCNMGFRAAEAEAAVAALELPETTRLEERLRAALRSLRK